MTPQLRGYQAEAIGTVAGSWANGVRRPAILLATGLGKTVIFSDLAHRFLHRRPVVLVHRDELVRQSVAKLRAQDPALRIGVVQGKELGIARTDVVVASVQTLIRRLDQIAPSRFGVIIVDECHHAAAKSYMQILEHFGAFDEGGNTLSLGVTATMSRGDGRGLGAVWDDVVFERDIRFGVDNGFLVPAEVRTVRLAELDTDRVRKGADGDLAPGALAKAMSSAHAGPAVARAYAEFAAKPEGGFRRGIVFAPTVETAIAWAGEFRALGVRAEVVTGETTTGDDDPNGRPAIYARVAAGATDVILSVMVLTEGFDLPAVEVAVIGRPTKSMALLTQMVGRVLRPSPATGKTAALVVDVVGAMGAGLARTLDLQIPGPLEPVAPLEPREALPKVPEPELPIPGVDWIAVDLMGQPIAPAVRRAGHDAPEWLRTYGGVPFLPKTREFPHLIYVGRDGIVWRADEQGERAPLGIAPGADVRAIHPGVKRAPRFVKATDAQANLLERLGLKAPNTERPDAAAAGEMLDVHFASKVLDR